MLPSYLILYHLDLKNGIARKELDEHMSIKWLSPTVTKISIKRNSELKQSQESSKLATEVNFDPKSGSFRFW